MLLDIILHLDAHLLALVHDYGVGLRHPVPYYLRGTGLVVAPFLPGFACCL